MKTLWMAMLVLTIGGSTSLGESPKFVAENASIERVATGYKFTEGPAVDPNGDVVFSDIPNSQIIHCEHATGKVNLLHENTERANGLMFDAQGRLIACAGGGRKLVRYEKDGTITTLTQSYKGKKLNSPNDLDITCDGGIYFTDPRYGKTDDMEMKTMGVYYLVKADRPVYPAQACRVADDLVRPNGLILSGDGRTLYVSDADGKTIYAYHVADDGALKNRRVFAKVPEEHRRASDGMTLDEHGNVYGTCIDGVRIWNPRGELIKTIQVPELPSNCTFAGPNRDWLYITAKTSLYRIKMNVKGRKPWEK